MINQTNALFSDRWLFTGREVDLTTLLQYNRSRYYDLVARRWLTIDSEGFRAGDANLYRYVGNHPNLAIDPHGTEEWNDLLRKLQEPKDHDARFRNLLRALKQNRLASPQHRGRGVPTPPLPIIEEYAKRYWARQGKICVTGCHSHFYAQIEFTRGSSTPVVSRQLQAVIRQTIQEVKDLLPGQDVIEGIKQIKEGNWGWGGLLIITEVGPGKWLKKGFKWTKKIAGKVCGKVKDGAQKIFRKGKNAGKNADKIKDARKKIANVQDNLRQHYTEEIEKLKGVGDKLLKEGTPELEIAEKLHEMRRQLGVTYKDMTPPDLLAFIHRFNVDRYGDKLGPTFEYLTKKKGKTAAQIIESASRPLGDVKQLGDALHKHFGDEIAPILKKYNMLH